METTDIRIGNYFKYGAKEVYISEILKDGNVGIYDGFGLDEHHPFEMLKPIRLTMNILERLGFTAIAGGENDYQIELFSIYAGHKGYHWGWDKTGVDVNIQYVHELQNLYFIITGKSISLPPIN